MMLLLALLALAAVAVATKQKEKREETEAMAEEPEQLELKYDAEAMAASVQRLLATVSEEPEDQLTEVMALLSVAMSRAGWVKRYASGGYGRKMERLIVRCLREAGTHQGLELDRYMLDPDEVDK